MNLFLISGLATGLMMYVYTAIAYFYLDSSFVLIFGIVASAFHIVGPIFLTYKMSFTSATNLYLTIGLIYQLSYSYYNGGQGSESFVWLGMHPILAGMLLGARSAIIWSLIALGSTTVFLVSLLGGYEFPQLLRPEGVFISDVFTSFGWIVTLTILVTYFLGTQKKNEELLCRKNEKINDLLRILTHDISNSLNVLTSASDLCKVSNEGDENQFFFEKMDMASDSINEVINNVRTLHNSESGWESIECKPCDLDASLKYCFKLLSDKAQEKNVSFRITPEHERNSIAMMDPIYFNHHVLMNVLTNAIKFSRPNSFIDIWAKNLGDEVLLVIRDYGVGIDKNKLDTIFDMQENKSTCGTAGEKGSGFGLVILDSFMKRFSGRVLIKSKLNSEQKNNGTEVTLILKKALTTNLKTNDLSFSDLIVKSIQSKNPYNISSTKENCG